MSENANEKKRKRQSDALESPSKKVSFGREDTAGIKVTFNNGDGLLPALVSSPGLTPPSIPFKPYTKPFSSSHANSKPKPSTHDLLLHSSWHPRLDYTASLHPLDRHTSNYVAVFDPQTNRLEVTPAHHLRLRSTLRSEVQESENATPVRTFAQQREQLGQQFGTKKAKKVIASRTENAIVKNAAESGKNNDVQSAILESMAESTAAAPKKEELAEAQLASKPIPKPDLSAETVKDVYTFTTLVPPDEARLVPVQEWQDKAQSGEEMKFSHRFPAFRVSRIGKSEDILKLKALRYLTLLLEFHDSLQHAGRAGKKVPKKDVLSKKLAHWPDALVDSVRRRFSNPANELPKWHMDNLYTHICALSLYVDGWTTDSSHLKHDLKMENKQIVPYFQELGCKVAPPTATERERMKFGKAQAAAVRMARLKLPLEFPKPRTARRR